MIYIIIPVHNRKQLTKNCLLSIKKQTYRDFIPIVIDDGSTDGTSLMVTEEFGNFVKLIKGDGNLWWAGATNLGISHALKRANSNDFILTLNNDLIVNCNYLQELINCYKKYTNSLIGSLALFKDNPERVVNGGVIWNKFTAKQKKHFKIGEKFDFDNTPEILITDLLPGRGTLIPVNVFKEIGLYDNVNFPQYMADGDFSLRAKKNNYKLLISTKAIVFSDVKETGINFKYHNPKIATFARSLFSIRSANNLKIRFRFAKKHIRFWYIYICFDTVRLIGSFVIHWFRYQKKVLFSNLINNNL